MQVQFNNYILYFEFHQNVFAKAIKINLTIKVRNGYKQQYLVE